MKYAYLDSGQTPESFDWDVKITVDRETLKELFSSVAPMEKRRQNQKMREKANGEAHVICGQNCVESSDPIGLLTSSKTVYVLMPNTDRLESFEKSR